MGYRVIDKNGVAFMSDNGREVIPCGGLLHDNLIEKNYFNPTGIKHLIEAKRIEPEGKNAKGPISPPSNKKADIPSQKKKGAKIK